MAQIVPMQRTGFKYLMMSRNSQDIGLVGGWPAP
jgi:hypothetical protein